MSRKIFFVLFFISCVLRAQSSTDAMLKTGLNYAYNFQLDEAEKIYKKVIELQPEQPFAYHYLAQDYLWAFLGSKDNDQYAAFQKYSDLAIQKAENILDDDPKNVRVLYMLANDYSFRAMANGANSSTIDAFWSSKKAVGYYEKTIDLNPEFYDAYKGLGVFNYALSFVPGMFKWALSLTGLSANREKSLDYLRLAYLKGKQDKTESAFHLAKVYSDYVAEYDSSITLLQDLVTKYPRNSLFHYQYGVVLIKAKKLDDAEREIGKVISLNHPKFAQINALANFLMGDIHFLQNQFDAAIKYYDLFLTSAKAIDYTGIANYRMALCYEITGDTISAKRHLLLARNGNLDIFEDAYAKKKSEQNFDKTLTVEDILLLKMKNDLGAGKYKIVYGTLVPLINAIDVPVRKAKALIYLSEAACRLGKYNESITYAAETDSLDYNGEKWIKPFSYYFRSKSYFAEKKIDEAQKYFRLAEDNNDYDFKESLEAELNHLRRRLNKK